MQANRTLLTDIQAAERLNVSVMTLRKWRLFRRGPNFLKLGSRVRYRPEDIDAYLDRQEITCDREGAGR